MNISVIIPVFHGEQSIDKLFYRIKEILESLYTFEVIFVHDGGTLLSWEKICELKDSNKSIIKGIRLSENFGQHNAVLCGIEYSNYDIIITLDEDLQHNPEDILKLINCQQKTNSDLVYAIYQKRKHSLFRNIGSYSLRLLISILIPNLKRGYSSYRLIRGEIAKKIMNQNGQNIFIDGTLARSTTKVAYIKVLHYESVVGRSSYTTGKLFKHTFRTLFSFFRSTNSSNNRQVYNIEEIV